MKNYLITGGGGFIGGHLITSLLNLVDTGSILILDIQPASGFEDKRVKYQYWDIRQIAEFNLSEEYEVCIHLAALCKEPGFSWEEYFETNYIGTKNVLDLCDRLQIKKVLFTSTMMVYKAGEERRDENSLTAPDTAYGISKLLAEKEIQCWAENDNLKSYGILRPSVVFGENERGNFTRLYYGIKSNRFGYVGRKTTVKSCVYVKDVCQCLIYLSKLELREIYNFAFIVDYQIGQIVKQFKGVFQLKAMIPTLPLWLLMPVSRFFLMLNQLGMKNSIHPRRIQKLYFSTNIDSQKIIDMGFNFSFDLESALKDWKNDCNNKDLY
ncbi:MAG: SDR family oxidoreductase [Reichenbachiella sp.]|uniref:NAD-dependent epimerase/dehydratase family protein n=1 Tax=Reichenbachiella sp. TaxID=2184521 RepID=UPI0032643F8F